MNPWSRVAGAVGLRRTPLAAIATVALLASGSLAVLVPQLLQPSGEGVTAAELAKRAGDADLDGLADVVENRLGSDRQVLDTLGQGVPDGWVYAMFGAAVDWNDTRLLDGPALVPPPEELPVPLREAGALRPLSVGGLYRHEAQGRASTAWWLDGPALNPLRWDNDGDGVADAWLLQHGLDPLRTDADASAPGDPGFTLREKYENGLDPTSPDSDRDGLADRAELSGTAAFGELVATFHPTDPRLFSSRGDGVADGFVARFGLDTSDSRAADASPVPSGLTVREAFQETERSCRRQGNASCDWAQRLVTGPVVDPTKWDSNGDGVPDVWVLREAAGLATPLDDARSLPVAESGPWDAQGGADGKPGLVVDELNPAPAPFKVSLADLYAYRRPSKWDEATQGPWWGGIPVSFLPPPESLPLAVALRGWAVGADTCRGCNQTRGENVLALQASSDPRLADSDLDGLSDLQEYLGQAGRSRTNPLDPDTDGDGLTDRQELAGGLGTDPLRRDTAGSFLTDGESFTYWTARHTQAVRVLEESQAAADILYGFLRAPGAPHVHADDLDRLQPQGSLQGSSSNILSADSDGDDIPNGAELMPNLYLRLPTQNPRPSTDPARKDSDGDSLPDDWEVSWSRIRDYNCRIPCVSPVAGFTGWPLDPSRYDSFNLAATELAPGDSPSDAGRNLKGSTVRATPTLVVPFSNRLAYQFRLNPYEPDSSPADGIPDLFAIQWGVRQQDAPASQAIPREILEKVDDSLAAGEKTFKWVEDAAKRLEGIRRQDVGSPVKYVFIDPTQPLAQVTLDSNLLGVFMGHEKGTWAVQPTGLGQPCPLPSAQQPPLRLDGPRADPRQALEAVGGDKACWSWIPYPLRSDIENGTNPWLDDFDVPADGLPDAWEMHYFAGKDPTGGSKLEASRLAGCEVSSQLGGLPPAERESDGGYCLTYKEAYDRGLDPTLQDTDGGGLPDWKEVALGFKPLDPNDDHGEEDWDGDGVLNRVEDRLPGVSRTDPDSDHDGLLDGDLLGLEPVDFTALGNGGGDLCLRRSGFASNMDHRPPDPLIPGDTGGKMTGSQLVDWYTARGILHDAQPLSRCPGSSDLLFKREGQLDRTQVPSVLRGSGQGSDPGKWSTTGNGIPDGWVVYWRDRAGSSEAAQRALDPKSAATATYTPDLDGDFPALAEYRWGRPADWNETRDGPWWGGLDPTRLDTDGDETWYRPIFTGQDTLDLDEDADGLPLGTDPHPGVDQANRGLVDWEGGRYVTDYAQLWASLGARRLFGTTDTDADLVPDALDRARVQVTVDALPLELSKASNPPAAFTVTGFVTAAEAPACDCYVGPPANSPSRLENAAPGNAPVWGATVKVLLSEGPNAPVAVLGAALTGQDGSFQIPATLATTARAPTLGRQASIGGVLYAKDALPAFPSGIAAVQPGPVQIWVMAEPNDPRLQPVAFPTASGDFQVPRGAVQAYKDAGVPNPTAVPGLRPDTSRDKFSQPLEAARIAVIEGRPEPDGSAAGRHVAHAAEGIWPGHSTPVTVRLKAGTLLGATVSPDPPRHGDPLTVAGRLTDGQSAPLRDRAVNVGLGPLLNVTQTDPDGFYSVRFDTTMLEVGEHPLRVTAQLGANNPFLDSPQPVDRTVLLAQDTQWDDTFRIGEDEPTVGVRVRTEADQALPVRGVLREVTAAGPGDPVPWRGVTLAIAPLGGAAPLIERTGQTGGDGVLDVTLPPLPAGTPLGTLRLSIRADGATPGDRAGTAEFFLLPRFATRIVPANGTAQVGQSAALSGRLERVVAGQGVGLPLTGSQGSILAESASASHAINVTGADGEFQVTAHSDLPARQPWSFRFVPADKVPLRASAPAQASALFVAPTALRLDPAQGTAGQPVAVAGTLSWGAAQPVPGQKVAIGWTGGAPVETSTDAQGRFQAALPARLEAGPAPLRASFNGSLLFLPSAASASAPVRQATAVAVQASDALLATDGATPARIALRLSDANHPLAGRNLHVTLRGPQGANVSVDRVTGSDGATEVRLQELGLSRPGAWTVVARYAGSPTENPATGNASFVLRARFQVTLDRVPSATFARQSIGLGGRLLASPGVAEGVTLEFAWDAIPSGTAAGTTGGAWMAQARVPELAAGPHRLTITPRGGSLLEGDAVEAEVVLRQSVDAVLDVKDVAGGGRSVQARLVGPDGQPIARSVPLVLARLDADGRIRAIHELATTPSGSATLELADDERGELRVLQVEDRVLALDAVFVNTRTLQLQPVAGPSGTPLAAWLAAGGIGLLGLLGALSYLAWRRKAQAGIEDLLREAYRRLLDPSLSAEAVIRRSWASLLVLLGRSGYRPRTSDTVRTITGSVEKAFGLPSEPWRTVSALFEAAAYSKSTFREPDRQEALRAFGALAAWLKTSKEETAA